MSEADDTNDTNDTGDVSDEVIIAVTDYLDGNLTGAAKADVEAKIHSGKPEDRAWKQTHDEMVEAKKTISGIGIGIRKQKAPETFVEDVTSTIHKRSAGRFFARRTLGDRVPFGALLVLAVLGLAMIGYFMWASETGSLESPRDHAPASHGSAEIVPKP